MIKQLKIFFKEALQDYGNRFWKFWIILYTAEVLAGLIKYFIPSLLPFLNYRGLAIPLLFAQLRSDFFSHPLYFLLLPLPVIINFWGFATLYFCLSGVRLWEAPWRALKNLHRYIGFVVTASLATILGFVVLSVPVFMLLNRGSLNIMSLFSDPVNYITILPAMLVLMGPGIYLLISFAFGPFILLFEGTSIIRALKESRRRIGSAWFHNATFIFSSFVLSGVAYLAIVYITGKLFLLIPASISSQFSFLIFWEMIPWVIAASFYDLAIFRFYGSNKSGTLLKENVPVKATSKSSNSNNTFGISPTTFKIIAAVVLVAVVLSFGIFPSPAVAGSFIRAIVGAILTAIICIVSYGTGCAAAFFVLEAYLGVALIVITTTVALQVLIPCDSGDPISPCESTRGVDQLIHTGLPVKITNVNLTVPTWEDYQQNPDKRLPATVDWVGAAPSGIREYIVATDGNQIIEPYSGQRRVTCTGDAQKVTYCKNVPVTVMQAPCQDCEPVPVEKLWPDGIPDPANPAGCPAFNGDAVNHGFGNQGNDCNYVCRDGSSYEKLVNGGDIDYYTDCLGYGHAEDPSWQPSEWCNDYGGGWAVSSRRSASTQDAQNNFLLEYNKTYTIQMKYETCMQLSGGLYTFKSVALCVDPSIQIGCGCDDKISNSCGLLTDMQITTPAPPTATRGSLEIRATIDGVEISNASFQVNYSAPNGITKNNISIGTGDVKSIPAGDYRVWNVQGGPGVFKNVTVTGPGSCNPASCIGPDVSKTLEPAKIIRFTFNFTSQPQQQLGILHLRSNLPDGTQFTAVSGGQQYPISTPGNISAPAGQNYTVTSVIPPQGYTYNSVSYSINPPVLPQNGDLTITFNFTQNASQTGRLHVRATKDGAPWENITIPVVALVANDTPYQNVPIPSDFDPAPSNMDYTVSYVSLPAGASSYTGATYSANPPILQPNGDLTLTLNFASQQQTGKIAVNATNNGTAWGDGSTSKMNFLLSINGGADVAYNDIPIPFGPTDAPAGNYRLTWVSGGPGGSPQNPVITQSIVAGQTTTFTFTWSSQPTGRIHISANNNGTPWTGTLHMTYMPPGGSQTPVTVPIPFPAGSGGTEFVSPAPLGNYNNIGWVSGGPTGSAPSNITITPSCGANCGTVSSGGDMYITLNWGGQNGTIHLRATLNGTSWTGNFNVTYNGSTISIHVPSDNAAPAGQYNITNVSNGPGTFQQVLPSVSQTLTGGGEITFNFVFGDIGYVVTASPFCWHSHPGVSVNVAGFGNINLYRCQGSGCTPGANLVYSGPANNSGIIDANVSLGTTYGYRANDTTTNVASNVSYATTPSVCASPLRLLPAYYVVAPGETATFNAYDGTGSYTWSAPAGGTYLNGTNLPTFKISYPTVGQRVITLSDSGGATKTAILDVQGGLAITCSASPNSAATGQPVTWNATATGGTGSYIYSWIGDDGLLGNSSSVTKTYSTEGTKSARVTVTSGSTTMSCDNTAQIGPQLPPIVSITANGSSGSVTVPNHSVALIHWFSQNADSCSVTSSVSPTVWTGTSGTKPTGVINGPRTYTATCIGPGGTTVNSVTINIIGITNPCSANFNPQIIYLGNSTSLEAHNCGNPVTYTCTGALNPTPPANTLDNCSGNSCSKSGLRPTETQTCTVTGPLGTANATVQVIRTSIHIFKEILPF